MDPGASINSTPKHAKRVMLWSVPRSISTVFEKCFSFYPKTQAIHEPFVCAFHFGPERHPPPPGSFLAKENQEEHHKQLDEIQIDLPVAFDLNQCTFKFAKEVCEGSFPGKELVFCKGMAYALDGRYDYLPEGYRHTFLIRNPYRVFPSYKKLLGNLFKHLTGQEEFRFCDLTPPMLARNYCFQEQYELMTYLQEHGEPDPIIIDADDLLTNPASIMRQYCTVLGIPFKEDMLEWPAGLDILKSWKGARQLLLGNLHPSGGYYDSAMSSTRFNPPKQMPKREELTDDILKCVDHSMPYYQKMYDMRIRDNTKT